MLKILQARHQQYVNRELPDVQAGLRKGRGTREQIANIRWIMEKMNNINKVFRTLISKPVRKYQIDWIKRMHADKKGQEI